MASRIGTQVYGFGDGVSPTIWPSHCHYSLCSQQGNRNPLSFLRASFRTADTGSSDKLGRRYENVIEYLKLENINSKVTRFDAVCPLTLLYCSLCQPAEDLKVDTRFELYLYILPRHMNGVESVLLG